MQKRDGPCLHGNYNLMGEAINLISIYWAPTMCQALIGAGARTRNKADGNPGPHRVYILVGAQNTPKITK